MKSKVKIITAAGLLIINLSLFSQTKKDSLGLPGDNFDLYGALELFKQSSSPEAFEKAINSPDNEVNNLDLDANGKVDYVKVVDKSKGDAHSLVLQVAVSKTELQDVAVVEVEKTGDGNAHVQIVGDEDLYGKNYIVEPKDEATADNSAASKSGDATTDDVYNVSPNTNNNTGNNNGNNNNYNYADNSYAGGGPPAMVNVWGWPSVQFMYGPAYVGWSSPWYYGYYPGWYQPWPPIYWGVYYRRVYHYHYPYFHRTYQYRCMTAHNYYYGMRSSSGIVRQNNRSGIYHQRQMAYRNNPVHGARYNAAPANAARGVNGGGRARENNVRVQPGNNVAPRTQQRGSNSTGMRQPGSGQVNSQPRQVNGSARGNAAPRQQQAQPARINAQPGQVRAQPQPANTQPRQMNSQPREIARPQGGMPGGGGGSRVSAPHGGGGGMGGGGGHRGR